MGIMPAVSRTHHFKDLDRQFGGDPAVYLPAYDAAIASLSSDTTMADLAGARVDPDSAEHFSGHWLSSWWPEQQPIEDILRRGLLEAFTAAREAELPLQTLVVAGIDDFEVVVVRGELQVTMLLLTPPPPHSGGHRSDDIRVVRRVDGEVIAE